MLGIFTQDQLTRISGPTRCQQTASFRRQSCTARAGRPLPLPLLTRTPNSSHYHASAGSPVSKLALTDTPMSSGRGRPGRFSGHETTLIV
jgi:hypothetical protein